MNETNSIDIYPCSKLKRVLAFLGDLLIFYILSVTMFQLVVFNISSAITNYSSKLNENLTTINKRMDVLYNNELLFYDKEDNKYSFSTNLDTTFDYFLRSYVIQDSKDPIYYYFNELSNNKEININEKYLEFGSNFFEVKDTKIVMKDEMISYLSPYFDPKDSLSAVGNSYLSAFRSNTFVKLYNFMLTDIAKYDLKDSSNSYIELTNIINENNNYNIKFNSINITISFFISFIIYYVIIPLSFKDRSTLTFKVLKLKRINMFNYDFIKRKNYIVIIVNDLLMSLSTIFFVGIIYMGLSDSFQYMHFLIISLISLLYIIINLIILLCNKFNRSLKELSTSSMVITNQDLETIYKGKGYVE